MCMRSLLIMGIRCASLLLWIVCPLTVHLADVVKEKPQDLSSSGWELHGSREFKFFNMELTWEEAEMDCIQYRGHLASVHNEGEDRFIQRLIKMETDRDLHTWLGGYNSPVVPSRWHWSDESNFDFESWTPGEPSGPGNCLRTNLLGGWGNAACDNKLAFVCARRVKGGADAAVRSDPKLQSSPHVVKEKPQVLSNSGWDPYGSHEFKFFNIKHTWEEAERDCIQHRGHLASVHDEDEDDFIKQLIKTATGRDTPTWLGGHNKQADLSRWYWSDESDFDFESWAQYEPDGSGHCLQTNYYGGWDDYGCKNKLPFVCAHRIRGGADAAVRSDPKLQSSPHVVKEKPQVLSNSGWDPYGSREFKFFNIKRTWEEAERDCIQHRGHLASVHDEDEDDFIKQLIKTATGRDTPTWLGGHNKQADLSRWYWSDESDFDFESWAQYEPDGSGHCLQTNYYGGWDDYGCKNKLPFVCAHRIRGGADAAVRSDPKLQSSPHVVKEKPQVLSNSGWDPYGSREFKFFNIKHTWEEAERDCIQHRGHLASVHDEDEDDFIKQLIKTATGRDTPTWLGGHNKQADLSRWYWSDESDFDFESWAQYEPDGSGHCLQTNYYGGWDDYGCKNKLPFVCARRIRGGADAAVRSDPKLQSSPHVVKEKPQDLSNSGWDPYGSREFKFFNIKRTWEEAERDCIQHRGHLASVHDEDEDDFIKQLIKTATGRDTPTWLGGHNKQADLSRWYWSDESDFDFESWAQYEPDGSGHCLQTNYKGGWDDYGCKNKLPFVCARRIRGGADAAVRSDPKLQSSPHVVKEKPQVLSNSGWDPYGSHEFKFFNIKRTWEEAERDCIQHRGHLASVHDEDEDDFIKQLIKTATGRDTPTWLGGHNKQADLSRWYWSDESDFDFESWAQYEPDGSGHCLQTNYYGGWDDIPCGNKRPFVCAR